MLSPRVALVAPYLNHGGGIDSVTDFLYGALQTAGYRPEVVSLSVSARDPASLRLRDPTTWSRGARIEQIEWKGRLVRHVGAWGAEFEFQRYRPRRRLTRVLNAYDLVQIVAGSPCWGLVARSVTPPVALQVAALAPPERHEAVARSRGLERLWITSMVRIAARHDMAALRNADTVFVETRALGDIIRTHVRPGGVVFAPPGIDTSFFRPAPRRAANGPIVCVGRFVEPRKNFRLLFEAYHQLRQTQQNVPPLVLVGSRSPKPIDWEVAGSLGLEEHIELRSDIPRDELAELYRKASIFLLSSDAEGLGIAILEAMASGLPVVSTDCGGPTTSIVEGETGFLVPKRDPAALAARARQILSDPALGDRLGAQARQRAVSRFSLEAAAKPFLDRYESMLGGSPARSPGGP